MSEGFVQSKVSLLRQSKPTDFQEVVFNRHKPKPKDATTVPARKRPDPVPQAKGDENRSFMRKARYEVMRFGLKGFDANKKKETNEALLVSLGAKPSKKKAINYKELKEIRKKEKEEAAAKQEFQSIGKTAAGLASAKTKNRRMNNKQRPRGDKAGGILDVYGTVDKRELPKKTRKD